MVIMNPSKLNKRITIQQEITNKKDEEGNPIPPEWKDVVTVWARTKTPFGKGFNYEIFAGNTENAVRTVNFFMRFRRGIDSKMRVLYDDRLFEIKAVVDVDEQHKETCLVCEERSIWQK
ncbi:phage head-tail adapter protein [Bacillus cereus]|nr:phage head-tail adapter protein [Bacillus cereus]